MKFLRLSILFVIILFTNNYNTIAQQTETFETDTVLFQQKGKLTFDYYLANGLMCFHGNFSFISDNGQLKVDGAYDNGKRNGMWKTYRKSEVTGTNGIHDSYVVLLHENYDNKGVTTDCLELWLPITTASHWSASDTNQARMYRQTYCRIESSHLTGKYTQSLVNKDSNSLQLIDGKIDNEHFFGTFSRRNSTVTDSAWVVEKENYFYGNCYRIDGVTDTNRNMQLFVCELDTTEMKKMVDRFASNSNNQDYLVGDTYFSIDNYKHISGFDANLWEIPDYRETDKNALTMITLNFVKTGAYRAAIEQARLDSLKKIEEMRLEKLRQDSIREAKILQQRMADIAELSQQIVDTHNALKTRYEKDKNNKDIFAAYQRVMTNCDVLKTDTDSSYLTYLQEYKSFQINIKTKLFERAVYDAIYRGKDSIVNLADEEYKAIASGYSTAFSTYNFSPTFSNLPEYRQYLDFLDSVLKVQSLYQLSLSQFKEINNYNLQIINMVPASQKDVLTAYKNLYKVAMSGPRFNNPADGALYLEKMQDFIDIQHLFDTIIAKRQEIERNETEIMTYKKMKGVTKSYQILIAEYDLTPHFSLLSAAKDYLASLDEVIRMQKRYKLVLSAPSNTALNDKLKTAQTPQEIKQIIGLQ